MTTDYTARRWTIGRMRGTGSGERNNRALMRDGQEVGSVVSEPGPAVVGSMTAEQVRERFGAQICASWPSDERRGEFGW